MVRRADPGSFRDPLSRVFVDDDGVWRGLSKEALADYEALADTQFFRDAVARGDIVGTTRVEDDRALPGEWAATLQHDRIDVLSYPYEWPFEMLRDAALLQLGLTRGALAEGVITKDGSSYNVQFVGAKPVFIDVGSFERLRGGEPWPGYRQFCELFLNPLLVQALLDVPFQPLLRGSIHGISPTTAADLLRGEGRFTKGVLTHVKLHARAERRYADADRERDVKAELQRAGFGPGLIDAQLKNLEKAVHKLVWGAQQSTWSDYSERSHYEHDDLQAKERFVTAAVESLTPGACSTSAPTTAGSPGSPSRPGRRSSSPSTPTTSWSTGCTATCAATASGASCPSWSTCPTRRRASAGGRRERMPFVERVRPDLVLCLAVVHHLALSGTVPLEEIVAFLADFDAPVVVEFPHHDDVMASRLLARKRTGVFDAYTREHWEQALSARFAVRASETIGTRTLYRCDPT